jgi:hypothetical protein
MARDREFYAEVCRRIRKLEQNTSGDKPELDENTVLWFETPDAAREYLLNWGDTAK